MAAAPDPSTHLFPTSLLPTSAASSSAAPPATSAATSSAGTPFALPPGYTMRPLARGDHATGMLAVLGVLTTVGDIPADRWLARFDHMRAGFGADGTDVGTYYCLVVCDGSGQVVGTGTVVVERKLCVSPLDRRSIARPGGFEPGDADACVCVQYP